MNEIIGTQLEQWHSDRRRFLAILGATAGAGWIGGLGPRLAYAVTLTKAQRDQLTQMRSLRS